MSRSHYQFALLPRDAADKLFQAASDAVVNQITSFIRGEIADTHQQIGIAQSCHIPLLTALYIRCFVQCRLFGWVADLMRQICMKLQPCSMCTTSKPYMRDIAMRLTFITSARKPAVAPGAHMDVFRPHNISYM